MYVCTLHVVWALIMKIRQEREDDFQEVQNLVERAFHNAKHSNGNEQDLVKKLRKSSAFVEQLSLVCEENERIYGYILFTKNRIGKEIGLTLAPVAVEPKLQKRGLGRLLIKRGLQIAKTMGFNFVCVLGDREYYSRFGFKEASFWKIYPPFEVDEKNFMALSLDDSEEYLDATLIYPKEFGVKNN